VAVRLSPHAPASCKRFAVEDRRYGARSTLKKEKTMANPYATFPKAAPRTATQAAVVAPPLNPTDIARAIDLLTNYMTLDQRLHPADILELQQLSATIKGSSNNQ
jgi:hypothetical protein